MILYSIAMHIVNILMDAARSVARAALDALFPKSPEEREIELLSPEQAFAFLPRATKLTADRAESGDADVYSVFAYKDPLVSRLVWSLKYAKSGHAADICGYALARKAQELADAAGLSSDSPITIVPIPMTAKRRRERGFDQVALLADMLEKHATRVLAGRQVSVARLLRRTAHSSRQTLKGRAERIESARGIFESIPFAPTNGSVIVIDDVVTTGSTIGSAIETLKKSGYQRVTGLSVAH